MLGTLFSAETTGSSLLAFLIHFKPNNHQPSHMVSSILLTLFLFSSASTPPQITQFNSLIPNTDYHPVLFYLLPPPGFHPLTSPLWFFKPEAVWCQAHSVCFPCATNSCYKHQCDSTPNSTCINCWLFLAALESLHIKKWSPETILTLIPHYMETRGQNEQTEEGTHLKCTIRKTTEKTKKVPFYSVLTENVQ